VCEGVKAPDAPIEPELPFERIDQPEKIIAGYRDGPKIEHGGNQAFYLPREDLIRLAEPGRFLSREFYYATAFHELAHSTGHARHRKPSMGAASKMKFVPFWAKR
jgi:antirestriction protein ArdC